MLTVVDLREMDLYTSARAFLWGIILRWYVLAPSILLDAGDYQERYIKPRLGWSIDLPSQAFPIALVAGLFLAAFLTYHDARGKAGKTDVTFEVHDFDFLLNHRDRGRPEQPFHMADVILRGRLRNTGDVAADIKGARAALMERGWFWIWRKVDEQQATVLLNRLRARVDPYHHDVSVQAHSSSRDISEIWVYPSIPVSLKPESKRAYRLRVLIDAIGQSHPRPVYLPLDMPESFRAGEASFQRVDEMRSIASESTQGTEESRPQ